MKTFSTWSLFHTCQKVIVQTVLKNPKINLDNTLNQLDIPEVLKEIVRKEVL